MTVMNLIRRYKRWNPVHPTYGAFWGLGIGFGCGVGWGPGFGPEAVGFVGSGCGVGFSVGVTLIGIGLGLPASGFTNLPWNGMVMTVKGVSNATSTFVLPSLGYLLHQSQGALSDNARAIDRGISNLCKTQVPRSRKVLLESRRRFLRKVQDSWSKVAPGEHVLQMQPLDSKLQSEPQAVSLSPPQIAPANKEVPSQSFPKESEEKK